MKADEEPKPSPHSEVDCFRCTAGATVGKLILRLATPIVATDRGDGRPPIALWAAVVAEDWPLMLREWTTGCRVTSKGHTAASVIGGQPRHHIGSAGEFYRKRTLPARRRIYWRHGMLANREKCCTLGADGWRGRSQLSVTHGKQTSGRDTSKPCHLR